MAIADISNQLHPDPLKNTPEEPAVAGKKIKCPYCGSDRLERLEKLPRPRSRSPSTEMVAHFYQRVSIAADPE
jgi:DNA-directed RNA polymerase subunit RPC12/RpoP